MRSTEHVETTLCPNNERQFPGIIIHVHRQTSLVTSPGCRALSQSIKLYAATTVVDYALTTTTTTTTIVRPASCRVQLNPPGLTIDTDFKIRSSQYSTSEVLERHTARCGGKAVY